MISFKNPLFQFFKLTGVITLFLSVFSCQYFEKEELLIEEPQLIEIIIDTQVAKAAIYKYPLDERDSVATMYFQQIYDIYKIDKYQLDHDITFLEQHPERYKKIMDLVGARIDSLRSIEMESYLDEYK